MPVIFYSFVIGIERYFRMLKDIDFQLCFLIKVGLIMHLG